MTSLSKYDGHRVRHLTAREFHQVAGRAGRAGYDTAGTVVVQAPDHDVENERRRLKAGDDPKKLKKLVRTKAPEGSRGTDSDEPRPPGPKKLTRRERRQLGRLRARKVKRVIRRVDPWSVLLLSLGFYLCLFVVLMVSGVLLWSIASSTGTIHQIEGVIKESFAEKSFTFDGVKLFRASFLGGLVLVIAGSGLNVLLCTLFNLISDLVGGIRVTVIEEESARPAS